MLIACAAAATVIGSVALAVGVDLACVCWPAPGTDGAGMSQPWMGYYYTGNPNYNFTISPPATSSPVWIVHGPVAPSDDDGLNNGTGSNCVGSGCFVEAQCPPYRPYRVYDTNNFDAVTQWEITGADSIWLSSASDEVEPDSPGCPDFHYKVDAWAAVEPSPETAIQWRVTREANPKYDDGDIWESNTVTTQVGPVSYTELHVASAISQYQSGVQGVLADITDYMTTDSDGEPSMIAGAWWIGPYDEKLGKGYKLAQDGYHQQTSYTSRLAGQNWALARKTASGYELTGESYVVQANDYVSGANENWAWYGTPPNDHPCHVFLVNKCFQQVDVGGGVLALYGPLGGFQGCNTLYRAVLAHAAPPSAWLHEFGHARNLGHIGYERTEQEYVMNVMSDEHNHWISAKPLECAEPPDNACECTAPATQAQAGAY